MVKELNKAVAAEKDMSVDEMIQELTERDELICTGDACAAHACGVYNVP